jgi:hypothetical protein
MNSPSRRRVAGTIFVIASAVVFAGNAPGAQTNGVVAAVWKEQRISFEYRSAGAAHTCAGLRTQLRSLLTLLGAHPSMTITASGCEDHATTRVMSIALASPVEATTENASELGSRDATDQLAARVRGESAALETRPRFAAEWKTIAFANALHLRLTPADCELLKQLRRELLPKLAIRVISDKMRCSSDLASGYRPQLVVAALVAAPDGSSGEQPPQKVRSAAVLDSSVHRSGTRSIQR